MADESLVVQGEGKRPARLLLATDPQGMAEAQGHLREWFHKKILSLGEDLHEVQAAVDKAKKNKWPMATLRNQLSRISREIVFYHKAQTAVEAGYFLIPNFPIDVFAVRKAKEIPPPNGGKNRWEEGVIKPEKLPQGEGKYVSGVATRSIVDVVKEVDSKGTVTTHNWFENTELRDVSFPVVAMKAEVMMEMEKAFALKLFDDIGICPPTRRPDPMIIGRIHAPKTGYTEKTMSFLICWFLDPKTL